MVQVPPLYRAKCVSRPTFWDIAPPYIPLFCYIWNKYRARKYRRPLIKGMQFLGYPAMYEVPTVYKAKCVSHPTFSDMALPYIHIPLFYCIWNKHRARKYRRPLIRDMEFLGYPALDQVPPLFKTECVLYPTFWDIAHPYITLLYYICNKHRAWKYLRPWLRAWNFWSTLLWTRYPQCINQIVFRALLPVM
jgi:hypothetical protein